VVQFADGRREYEERPGEALPNQSGVNNENVMPIYFMRAPEPANEIRVARRISRC
jgi:hypothetical protein